MRAVVFYGVNDIRFEPNWPEPRALRPGEVRLATSWCGICGTDMEDYERGAVIPVSKPHPESGRMAPLVIGHEFSGRIVESAGDVRGLETGQQVAVECARPCKHCHWCALGDYAACENLVSIGQADDGGMADYVVVPAENCVPIPDGLGEDTATLAEPLAVMVRAIRQGRLQAGELVTVVGAGAIGLCGIAMAKAAGARKVIAVTHGGRRADVSRSVGADHVLDSRVEDWKEEYRDLTSGHGADLVLDAGGNIEAMRLALELTCRGGRCVIASVVDADIPFPGLDILLREKQIIGSCAHAFDREFAWAVQYLADGRVNLDTIITDRIDLAQAVELGFRRLLKDHSQIKILVTSHRDWIH